MIKNFLPVISLLLLSSTVSAESYFLEPAEVEQLMAASAVAVDTVEEAFLVCYEQGDPERVTSTIRAYPEHGESLKSNGAGNDMQVELWYRGADGDIYVKCYYCNGDTPTSSDAMCDF